MSLWDRLRAAFRRPSPAPEAPRERPPTSDPTLAEMRTLLRAGMTRDEFFDALEELVVTRGLRIKLPTADDRLVALPVAEGDDLLCFLPDGFLNYVEYKGGIFLEKNDDSPNSAG